MSGKKKNRNQDTALKLIVLITALLNLADTVMKIIDRLTG